MENCINSVTVTLVSQSHFCVKIIEPRGISFICVDSYHMAASVMSSQLYMDQIIPDITTESISTILSTLTKSACVPHLLTGHYPFHCPGVVRLPLGYHVSSSPLVIVIWGHRAAKKVRNKI